MTGLDLHFRRNAGPVPGENDIATKPKRVPWLRMKRQLDSGVWLCPSVSWKLQHVYFDTSTTRQHRNATTLDT